MAGEAVCGYTDLALFLLELELVLFGSESSGSMTARKWSGHAGCATQKSMQDGFAGNAPHEKITVRI